MSIQDGINKALGIGAVLATQSPLMENQKIKAAKESEVKRLNTQAGILEAKAKANVDPNNVYEKTVSKQETDRQFKEADRLLKEINRRLFELNPTNKTAKGYYSGLTFNDFKRMDYLNRMNDLTRMQDANNKAEEERYNRQVQNQSFKILKESKKNGKT